MPIDYTKKILFIHIPKTGGSSITEKLFGIDTIKNENHFDKLYGVDDRKRLLQHLSVNQIQDILDIRNYKVFATVRNPYTKIISEYEYIKTFDNTISKMSFEEYIISLYNLGYAYQFYLYSSFYPHVWNQKYFTDSILLNIDIIHFEDLQNEFIKLMKFYNIELNDFTLPKVKYTNGKRNLYDYYINDNLKEMVFEMYECDFNLFNYSK